jgi:hypothetical protein
MLRLGSLIAVVSFAYVVTACGGSGRSNGNKVIVLDRSMGGVALGEKRADVERRLGHGFVLHVGDQKPPEPRLYFEDVLYSNGLEVGFVSRNATPSARARGRVAFLLTRSPRFRTPEGVHVGSTAAELRSIKGVKCVNLANLDCQHGGHVHNQAGTMFRLSAPNGVVARIAVAYSD